MNVLLAETDVPYEKLMKWNKPMKNFNCRCSAHFRANDVVNPVAAKEDTSSPIYGMPILEVELQKRHRKQTYETWLLQELN